MPQTIRTLIKFAVGVALAAGFLWLAFQGVDPAGLWSALSQASVSWLALSVFLLVLSIPPRAWRWQILLKPVSRRISFQRASHAILVGYAATNVVSRAGEIARGVALQKDERLPLSGILATILVERAIDMLALLIFMGGVLYLSRNKVVSAFPWMEGVALLALAVTVGILVLFALLSVYGDRALNVMRRPVRWVSPSFADRLTGILRSLFQGLGGVHATSGYVGILVYSIFLNLAYILTSYVTFFAFGFPSRYDLGFYDAVVVLVISTIGVIIPTPGGTGTYHYFCSQTLNAVYDVPLTDALAYATAMHGLAFATYLVAGGPGLIRLLLARRLSAVDSAGLQRKKLKRARTIRPRPACVPNPEIRYLNSAPPAPRASRQAGVESSVSRLDQDCSRRDVSIAASASSIRPFCWYSLERLVWASGSSGAIRIASRACRIASSTLPCRSSTCARPR